MKKKKIKMKKFKSSPNLRLCTLSPLKSADMLKTLQPVLSLPQPKALDDVLAESFSPNRREICSASFGFLQLLSISQCAE